MGKNKACSEELIDGFKELLKKNGLKYTQQREALLRTVCETKGHFTPEELYQAVQKKFPNLNVGIATVYRSLGVMEQESLVTSVSFGVNGKKYEFGQKEHHDHMICDKCGKMIEFVDETIEKRQEDIASQYDFKITNHSMQIHGICHSCQAKEE